jgi:hydrogenase maturation factor
VFLALKFILEGVTSAIKNLTAIIQSLDARVKAMNTDIVKIDTLVSAALNVQPDTDRIARAEREDARKD